jgi:thioesterase domain-containing protein
MLAALLDLLDDGDGGTGGGTGGGTVGGFAGLRHVWCGGEVLTPELFERFRARTPTTLYHGYGPAETTIGVSHVVYREGADRIATSIGRANPSTRLHVLDRHLQPVGVGVAGELYAGGFLVGRGYANRPGLTASRFVADPFGPPGSVLYRTGDVVRWAGDGTLDFLGRADNQVKIRGMRVEPEEVEAVLATHPRVRAAAVVVRPDASGRPALSGHVVAPALTVGELREWATGQLPAHLVPADLTVHEALPLTPNGKVDRRALAQRRPEVGPASAGPGTAVEAVLCAVLAEVLGVAQVGPDDDFFALGGHSLLLVRLRARIRERLGREIGIATLFATPTVRGLAAVLDADPDGRAGRTAALSPIVALRRGEPAEPPLVCVHPAGGMSWQYAGLNRVTPTRLPILGVQSPELVGGTAPTGSLDELAARYVDELLQVRPHGPFRLLGWSFGGCIAHAMACELQARGHAIGFLGLLDALQFDPALDAVPPDESAALVHLLRETGYPLEGPDRDGLTLDRATRIVRAEGGVLGGLDGAAVRAVVRSFVTGARIRAGARYGVVRADVLFVEALRPDEGGPAPRARRASASWAPHVDGRLDVVGVDFRHIDLLTPAALDEIAPLITERLVPRQGDR